MNVKKMASHRSISCRAGSVRTSSPRDACVATGNRGDATRGIVGADLKVRSYGRGAGLKTRNYVPAVSVSERA